MSQFYDVIAAVCALIGGMLASYRLFTDQGTSAGLIGIGSACGVCACAILRADTHPDRLYRS